jgi:enterochelin esterase-like enzyme
MVDAVMRNPLVIICLSLILFVGCATEAIPAALESDCTSPGTVLRGEVSEASRGYPYTFGIYLPPCYNSAADPGYPAIYLVPGRGSGVNAWFAAGVNEIADELILAGEVPSFIIVTTENTNTDPYADEIYQDLIPYIENHYPVLTDRRHRAVAGGSLGGIAAYRLTFQHPADFASAGMFGSGVINGENDQVIDWLAATTAKTQPRVFLNVGEQDPLMLDQARAMAAILDDAGISHEFIVGEGAHTYEYWVTNFATYLRWVAQDW